MWRSRLLELDESSSLAAARCGIFAGFHEHHIRSSIMMESKNPLEVTCYVPSGLLTFRTPHSGDNGSRLSGGIVVTY